MCSSDLAALVVLGTVACGGGQKTREEAAAQSAEQAAQQMATGAAQMGKALESLANGMPGANPDQKPVDPVSFRELQTVLPADLAGWERGSPTGERMTQPVNFSEASVGFSKGDASLSVKVTDTSFNQLLVAPFTMFLATGYERETSDGYEKSMKLGEHPGWTKWNRADKRGELNLVVANRFLVQIEGSGLPDEKVLSQVASATNLKRLAELH